MALDFPSSPTNGQVYSNYYYDSTVGAWRANAPLAVGVPLGGAANSFLSKSSTTDYDTQWATTLPVANGGTGAVTGSGFVPIIPASQTFGTGTGSVSSNGLITFTNTNVLKVMCFSSAYNRYRIYLDIQTASTNDYVYWRGLDAAGTQNATSAYYTGSMYQQSGVVGAFDSGNTVQTYSRLGYAVNDDAHSLIMDIFNPFQTRKTKGTFVSQYSATGLTNLSGAYNFNATTSFSGIQFALFNGVGAWTGTMRVFGVL